MARVIMLELNELTPRLVHKFMEDGDLPNFKKLYERSHVYETSAGEEGLNLNPWIQWVTVHTGQAYRDHGVYLLGEGHKIPITTISELVSDSGLQVGQFGSMNIGFKEPLNGYAMPDPWADGISAYPEKLEPFRKFVQSNVQEHSNPAYQASLGDKLSFVGFLLANGLRIKTGFSVLRQLISERFSKVGWKRSFLLDHLQWDVFESLYKKNSPHFATYFSNSVAHAQHTHWREFEPENFSSKPSAEEIEQYADAVPYAYRQNDEIIAKALDIADEDTVLIFCTALSQGPALQWEESGGKTFYRPFDLHKFCCFVGLSEPFVCKPVMSEEFWIETRDDEHMADSIKKLEAVMCDGRQLMKVWPRENGLYASVGIYDAIPPGSTITTGSGDSAPIEQYLYQSEDIKSGAHDPRGLLWISTPTRDHKDLSKQETPLESIAPTILSVLGVESPTQMKAASLL